MIGHITETYTNAARRHCHHSEYVLQTDVRSGEGNEISNEESIESSVWFLFHVSTSSATVSVDVSMAFLPVRLR